MDLAGLIAQQATWESHLMNAAEATNQPDATSAGTPLDYSESVYRFYLELADCSPAATTSCCADTMCSVRPTPAWIKSEQVFHCSHAVGRAVKNDNAPLGVIDCLR